MPTRVLLDTSIIIEYLRASDKQETVLYSLARQKVELSLSIITYAELFSGKSMWENERARATVEKICKNMQLIPLSQEIAVVAGKIRAETGVDLLDACIAASAVVGRWTLVTLNKEHFRKIAELKILE